MADLQEQRTKRIARLPRRGRSLLRSDDAADGDEASDWAVRWLYAFENVRPTGVQHSSLIRRMPTLVDSGDYGDPDGPQYRVLLFALAGGTTFSDFEHMGPRLATSLSSEMVVIEHAQRAPGIQEHLAFTLSHELTDDWDPLAHLDNSLNDALAGFAVRCAVINAFRDLGLPAPMALSQHRLVKLASDKTLWRSRWSLTAGCDPLEVLKLSRRFGDVLRCEFAGVFTEAPGTVTLLFGHEPDPHHIAAQDISWLDDLQQEGLTYLSDHVAVS